MNFNPHSQEGSDEFLCALSRYAIDFNPHSQEGSDVISLWSPACTPHFNPHSQEGSDESVKLQRSANLYFNPHSQEGSDGFLSSFFSILEQFQSTLPRREWLYSHHKAEHLESFQSTLPRREWRPIFWSKTTCSNFNPHSQEGSDAVNPLTSSCNRISIHTPKKGVTRHYWFWRYL